MKPSSSTSIPLLAFRRLLSILNNLGLDLGLDLSLCLFKSFISCDKLASCIEFARTMAAACASPKQKSASTKSCIFVFAFDHLGRKECGIEGKLGPLVAMYEGKSCSHCSNPLMKGSAYLAVVALMM